MNRSIAEKVICLKLNVWLFKYLWLEVVNMIVYFINRSRRCFLKEKFIEKVWIEIDI